MKRKIFSILLSLALVVSMIPAFGVTASADEALAKPECYWDGTSIVWQPVDGADTYTVLLLSFPDLEHLGSSIMDAIMFVEGTTIKEWNLRSGTSPNGISYVPEVGYVLDVTKLIQYNNDYYRFNIIAYKNDKPGEYYTSESVKGGELKAGYLSPLSEEWISGPVNVQIKDIKEGEHPDFSATQDNKYCTLDGNATIKTNGITNTLQTETYSKNNYYTVSVYFTGKVINGIQYVFPTDQKVYINGKEATFTRYGMHGMYGRAECDFTPISNNAQTRTVTFNANGGSGSMPDMTVDYGGWLKFPECTFTPPAGATFAGWKLAYRDSVYDPGNSVTIYQDTIYYAIWKGGSVVSNDFDTHYVNTGALNMRAKPDTGSERIGGLKKGDLVMLLDSDGEWFQISYRGLIGWVQNKYLDRVIGGWEYPFTDITEGTFDYVPILWAYNAKPQVTNGITSTRFGPKETVTRGQCVTFLWRAMGEPEPKSKYNPFVDVPESQYYYKPILWAVEKGITKGTDKNHFSPDQKLSTAHIITFLYRTLGKGSDGWYQEAGNWASSNGLLDRTGLTVSPSVDCPRGAVVTFLYRTK